MLALIRNECDFEPRGNYTPVPFIPGPHEEFPVPLVRTF